MKEYLKVKLNIIDNASYQQTIERFKAFLFSLELPIQYGNTFEAYIKESVEDELTLSIRDKYAGSTNIPFSKLHIGAKIFVLDSMNRQQFNHCAEATVLERYFEAAKRRTSTTQAFKPLTAENSEVHPLNLALSQRAFNWIKLGHTPSSMEEKWHIFFEEGILHFARSWTNTEVFKVKINKNDNTYFLSEVQKHTQFGDIEILKQMLYSMMQTGSKVFDKD